MKIFQANSFKRVVKNMHSNQKGALDAAVKVLAKNPEADSLKFGDLSGLRVYKYHLHKIQFLLGYCYIKESQVIHLVSIGTHENFYRDLKR